MPARVNTIERAEQTTRASAQIIEAERRARLEKTKRLKQTRLAAASGEQAS
jgi:hypothetical protein